MILKSKCQLPFYNINLSLGFSLDSATLMWINKYLFSAIWNWSFVVDLTLKWKNLLCTSFNFIVTYWWITQRYSAYFLWNWLPFVTPCKLSPMMFIMWKYLICDSYQMRRSRISYVAVALEALFMRTYRIINNKAM